MGTLKDQLTEDLHAAMKAREETTTATLRMALAAVRSGEVAGKAARELSDDEVRAVLTKEARRRREAAEAYEEGGRSELAAQERAEFAILERYLPAQLSDQELSELVAQALASGGFTATGEPGRDDAAAGGGAKPAMGPAMKAAQAAVAGRAEGARVAAEVRRQLDL